MFQAFVYTASLGFTMIEHCCPGAVRQQHRGSSACCHTQPVLKAANVKIYADSGRSVSAHYLRMSNHHPIVHLHPTAQVSHCMANAQRPAALSTLPTCRVALQGCGIVKPGEQLTVASNFLQVVAGGVLAQKAAALKKLLLHLAPYNGVYMVFVRPPGARPHEWTPVYHGQATDQTVGERCASYLGGGVFCCDTTTDKCKMCKDFADRGFDVAVM